METADLSSRGWANKGYSAHLSIILLGPNEAAVIVEGLTAMALRRLVIFRIDKNMRRFIVDVGDPYTTRTGAES